MNRLLKLTLIAMLSAFIINPIFGQSNNTAICIRTEGEGNSSQCLATDRNGDIFKINNEPVCLAYNGQALARIVHPNHPDHKLVCLANDGNLGTLTIRVGNKEEVCPLSNSSSLARKEILGHEVKISIKRENTSLMLPSSSKYEMSDVDSVCLIAVESVEELPKEKKMKEIKQITAGKESLKDIIELHQESLKKFEQIKLFLETKKDSSIEEKWIAIKQMQSICKKIKDFSDKVGSRFNKVSEFKKLVDLNFEIDTYQNNFVIELKKLENKLDRKLQKEKLYEVIEKNNVQFVKEKLKVAQSILKAENRLSNAKNAQKAFDKISRILNDSEKNLVELINYLSSTNVDLEISKKIQIMKSDIDRLDNYREKAYNDYVLKNISEANNVVIQKNWNQIATLKTKLNKKVKDAQAELEVVQNSKDLNEAQKARQKIVEIQQEVLKLKKEITENLNHIDEEKSKSLAEHVNELIDQFKQCVEKSEEPIKTLMFAQQQSAKSIEKRNELIRNLENQEKAEKARINAILQEIKKQYGIVEIQFQEAKQALKVAEDINTLAIAQESVGKVKNAKDKMEKAAEIALEKAFEITNNLEAQILVSEIKNSLSSVNQISEKTEILVNNIKEEQEIAAAARVREAKILKDIKAQYEIVRQKLNEANEALQTAEKTNDLKVAEHALAKIKATAEEVQNAAANLQTKAKEIANNVEAQKLSETAISKVKEAQNFVYKAQNKVDQLIEAQRLAEEARAKLLKEIKNQHKTVEQKLEEAKKALRTIDGTSDLKVAENALNELKEIIKKAKKVAKNIQSVVKDADKNVEALHLAESAKDMAKKAENCFDKATEKVKQLKEARKLRSKEAKILEKIKENEKNLESKHKDAKKVLKNVEKTTDLKKLKEALRATRKLAADAQKTLETVEKMYDAIEDNEKAKKAFEKIQDLSTKIHNCVKDIEKIESKVVGQNLAKRVFENIRKK